MRILLCAFVLIMLATCLVAQVPNQISYQGYLTNSLGTPLSGPINITFKFYDAPSGGVLLWNSGTQSVNCSNGNFAVYLGAPPMPPIGPIIVTDTNLYLGITVGTDAEMSPRTRLATQPYAYVAFAAGTAEEAYSVSYGSITSNSILDRTIQFIDLAQNGAAIGQTIKWNGLNWVSANDSVGGGAGGAYLPLTGGTLTGPITNTGNPAITMGKGNFGTGNINSGTDAFVAGNSDTASGNYSTVGGGISNRAGGLYATIGGGQSNIAVNYHSVVGGGLHNIASQIGCVAAGGQENVASGVNASVGGGSHNTASTGGASVAGGNYNIASGGNAAVGGGQNDTAMGDNATVSGGHGNNASGDLSTIGGGGGNKASAPYAYVGGGYRNLASGETSAVGGGGSNNASGLNATIPGGSGNAASGTSAFAAGTMAKATHDGSFVWADYSWLDLNSFGVNTFTVRSVGGVRFYTNTALTSGVQLASGGGSWSSVSDRNLKSNFSAINGPDLLAQLEHLDVSTWNYKSQDQNIRHIGPMAQDFYKAFGVGEDSLHITSVDADGVALAAIKALNTKVEDLTKQNADLKAEIAELKQLVQAQAGKK